MATIREILKRRKEAKAKAEKVRQEALGPVMLRESQATPETIKSITDKGAVAQVVSGTPTNFTTTTYTSSSGGRGVTTSSGVISQTKNIQLEAQRQAELNRQAELVRQAELQKAIQQRNLQRIAELNRQAKEKLKQDALKVARKSLDVVSGGRLITQKNLTKRQSELNEDVAFFNKKFSGTLSESEAERARIEKARIEREQKKLNEEMFKFEKSPLKVIGDVVWGKSTIDIKTTPKQIEDAKKSLLNSQKKLAESNTKVGKLFWSRRVKEDKEALDLLNIGKAKLSAPSVPISPAAGVSVVSKVSKIKFIGSQKSGEGGKLITDIAFISDKGKTLGFARGVTISKGKGGLTITKGALGKPGIVAGTNKLKFTSKKLFGTVDKSVSKDLTSKLIREIELLNQAKRTGKTVKISNNINKLVQTTIGKSAITKGGKAAAKTTMDDFAALSSITKKGDWSRIIGNSITSKGAKAEFIGFIKGQNTLSSTGSSVLKLQRKTALNKVLGAASAALSKVENVAKVQKLTKAERIAAASKLIGGGVSTAGSLISRLTSPKTMTTTQINNVPKVQEIVNPKIINVTPIPTPKPLPPPVIQKTNTTTVNNTLQDLATSQLTVQQNIQDLKSSSKLELTTTQKQQIAEQLAQQQGYSQSLALAQRQLQQLKTGITPQTPLFNLAINPKLIIPPLFKKKKGKLVKSTKKSFLSYGVYIKKNNKFVKIKSNLTQKDAKDYLAYVLDNKLSRTGYIKPEGKTKKQTIIPTNYKGYFSKTSKKFRPYRIKSKTKIPIKGYIEKQRYALDKPGEKIQISSTQRNILIKRLKRARQIKSKLDNRKVNKLKTPQTTKRKITPKQRKELLSRLKKAREVRMRNLKKRR